MGKKSKGKAASKRQKEKRSSRLQALTQEELEEIKQEKEKIEQKLEEEDQKRAERKQKLEENERKLEENRQKIREITAKEEFWRVEWEASRQAWITSRSKVDALMKAAERNRRKLEETEQRRREENESRVRELVQQMNRQMEERSRQLEEKERGLRELEQRMNAERRQLEELDHKKQELIQVRAEEAQFRWLVQLVQEAGAHFDEGEWRAYYDKCLQAVLTFSYVFEPIRISLLDVMFRIIVDEGIKEIVWTKEDKKFLQHRFVDNESEPIICRAIVAVEICKICWVKAKFHGQHIYSEERIDNMTRHAIELIGRSPPENDQLQMIGSSVKHHLQYLRNILLFYWTDHLPTEPLSNFWGGDKCDCCGKAAHSMPRGLLKCERCDLMFYCSKDCQVKDWRSGGHKKSCCKKGSIHPGDIMLFKARTVDKPPMDRPMDPHLVKILEPSEEKPGKWVASPVEPKLAVMEDLRGTYPEKHLSHIRPDCMEELQGQLIKGREEREVEG